MKKAFTLMETLIVIAIIGVVAALTLPALIRNYEKRQTVVKLKRVYAVLNGAINMAKAEYGTDINRWAFCLTNNTNNNSDYFAEHYLIPYLNLAFKCDKNNNNNQGKCANYPRTFYLNTGERIEVLAYLDRNSTKRVQFYITTDTKRSIIGKTRFLMELGGGTGEYSLNKNKIMPYGWYISKSCSYYKSTSNGCNNSGGSKNYCFALIMCENWEIKKDYPW